MLCDIKIVFLIFVFDFFKFGQEVWDVVDVGVDWIYLDVMDGYFVFNIIFGLDIIVKFWLYMDKVFDIYLMIVLCDFYLEVFVKVGLDIIMVYVEVGLYLDCLLQVIWNLGKKVGVLFNLLILENVIEYVFDWLDFVFVMIVNLGFGGQKFIEVMVEKICWIKQMIGDWLIDLEIDGGVIFEIVLLVIVVGVNVFVVGFVVFKGGLVDYYLVNILVICVVVDIVQYLFDSIFL